MPKIMVKNISRRKIMELPRFDAVAELVERESAVGKTAVCGLTSGSLSPMFSCTGQNSEFGNSIVSVGTL